MWQDRAGWSLSLGCGGLFHISLGFEGSLGCGGPFNIIKSRVEGSKGLGDSRFRDLDLGCPLRIIAPPVLLKFPVLHVTLGEDRVKRGVQDLHLGVEGQLLHGL